MVCFAARLRRSGNAVKAGTQVFAFICLTVERCASRFEDASLLGRDFVTARLGRPLVCYAVRLRRSGNAVKAGTQVFALFQGLERFAARF